MAQIQSGILLVAGKSSSDITAIQSSLNSVVVKESADFAQLQSSLEANTAKLSADVHKLQNAQTAFSSQTESTNMDSALINDFLNVQNGLQLQQVQIGQDVAELRSNINDQSAQIASLQNMQTSKSDDENDDENDDDDDDNEDNLAQVQNNIDTLQSKLGKCP